MSAHTPEPWTYYEPHSQNGGWIMTDARAWDRQITGMFYGRKSERIANGHLIAAAPDLLKACEAALRSLNAINKQIEGLDLPLDDIRNAIAKAKGDQS